MTERVEQLRPAPYNPRKISDKRLKALKKSLEEFGDLSGIVFNRKTRQLVGGHQRIKVLDQTCKIVAKPHKDKKGTVAVGYVDTKHGRFTYREVDWNSKREAAANIAANIQGGVFDIPKYKELAMELDDGTLDLDLIDPDGKLKGLIDGSDDLSGTLDKKFEVVIECKDEKEQQVVFEKLSENGYTCRVLTV